VALHWEGNYCNDSKLNLTNLLDKYFNWSLSLDARWGGLAFITPTAAANSDICGLTWTIDLVYNFLGSYIDDQF
jgi:hypothetical protein